MTKTSKLSFFVKDIIEVPGSNNVLFCQSKEKLEKWDFDFNNTKIPFVEWEII